MKFSHSLQFNAVPEWSSKYINYSGLKKICYALQREYAEDLSNKTNNEVLQFTQDPNDPKNPINVFTLALDAELIKIDKFFESKETFLFQEYNSIIIEFEEFEREFPYSDRDQATRIRLKQLLRELLPSYQDQPQEQSIDNQIPLPSENVVSPKLATTSSNNDRINALDKLQNSLDDLDLPYDAESLRLTKKKSLPTLFDDDDFDVTFLEALRAEKRKFLSEVFSHLSELKSYIELNKIGFGKILKKFDKLLQTHLKKDYLQKIFEHSYTFQPSTLAILNDKMGNLIRLYSIFTDGNIEMAKSELRTNLREKVVFERNTVWRDMIGMERKSQAAYARKTKIGEDEFDEDKQPFSINIGVGRSIPIPSVLLSMQFLKSLIIICTTGILLIKSPFEDVQQKNCFAVLICASLLWASETVPLFVTSLLLPFLLVVLKVLKDPVTGKVFNAADASKFICASMWSPIILLLLGGFTLAAALSKYNLDKFACTFMLSKVPQKPAHILFAIMCVSTIVAAFVSNVAAPVLMFSVVQPILNTLSEGSGFAQALVIGIALASDVAGMASPIASPQNVFALQSMNPAPNWLQWFTISIPVCSISLVLIFIYLMFSFNFSGVVLVPIKSPDEKFTFKHYYVLAVSVITIVLWCLASLLEPYIGDMGMIALASMVAFYATGILSPDDFNNYPWTIVILAMGGLALGKAVTVSGLLKEIAQYIQELLMDAELFTVLASFGILVLTMATFVSHTVAALIIVPLIAEIGKSLPDPHPNLLVMATALLCSCAMGLPTSGFPNVTAIGLRDNVGNPYLSVGMFIKIGLPSSILCYLVVIFVGYLLMKLLQF